MQHLKRVCSGWKRAQWLRADIPLAEFPSLVLTTRVGWIPTSCNSSFRKFVASFCLLQALYSSEHTSLPLHKIKNKFLKRTCTIHSYFFFSCLHLVFHLFIFCSHWEKKKKLLEKLFSLHCFLFFWAWTSHIDSPVCALDKAANHLYITCLSSDHAMISQLQLTSLVSLLISLLNLILKPHSLPAFIHYLQLFALHRSWIILFLDSEHYRTQQGIPTPPPSSSCEFCFIAWKLKLTLISLSYRSLKCQHLLSTAEGTYGCCLTQKCDFI